MGDLREGRAQAWPDSRTVVKLNQIKQENPKMLG